MEPPPQADTTPLPNGLDSINLNTPYVEIEQPQQQQQINTTTTTTTTPTTMSMISYGEIEFADFKDSAVLDGTLKLQLQVPPPETERKLLLIVMVDKSGSMRHVWNQVQTALQYLFTNTLNQPNEVILELVFFNNTAFRLPWTVDNYRELLMNERASGKTCFAALFSLVGDILRQYFRKGTAFKSDLYYDPKTDVSLVLLTDGSHTTVRDHRAAFSELQQLIKTIGCATITTHTMGFTENSRYSDLDGIRRILGSRPGIYQYAEPSDGPHALHDKLNFIFKWVFTTGDTFESNLCFDVGDNIQFMESGSSTLPMKLIFDVDGLCDVNVSVTRRADSIMKPVNFTLQLENKRFSTVLTPSLVAQTQDAMVIRNLSRYHVELNKLYTRVNSHDQKNVPSDENKKQYIKELLDLQKLLNDIDNALIFTFSRVPRQTITEMKTNCLNQISQLLELVNGWIKTEWTAKTSARMANITYQFMFKNAGRQRRATMKITRNANTMMREADNLKQVDVDIDEVLEGVDKDLLEASQSLFSCTLSLCNWAELVEEHDCLGFGLSIQRPETVIDDPTQIRINDYSTTFLGKSTLEDAIALSVHSVGQEKTTGGFEVGRDKIAAAVRGRGREPINAWMPLYLHDAHWQNIKFQLRNIIAYYTTLDPMAFSYDQINTIFLLLGTMVSKDIGERQLQLIIQFIRTCREITHHFKFQENIKKQLISLLTKPVYNVSEQPKNIFVVIGYLMIFTDNEIKELLGNDIDWIRLWESLVESAVRRSSFTFLREKEQSEIDGVVNDILYGEELTCDTDSKLKTEEDWINNIFEQVTNYESKEVNIRHDSDDIDKYLNIRRLQPTPNSKNDFKIFENRSYNLIAKYSNLLENRGYPTVTAMKSCLQFVYNWRNIVNGRYKPELPSDFDAFKLIDSQFGVAPTEWIDYIKSGMTNNSTNSLGNYLAAVHTYYTPTAAASLDKSIILYKLKSMICQGVMYRVNRVANAAVERGVFTDTCANPLECLSEMKRQVDDRQAILLKKMEQALYFSQRISSGLKSTDLDLFSSTIPKHGEPGFPIFIQQWQKRNLEIEVPFAEQKVLMILSNVRILILDNGEAVAFQVKKVVWNIGKKAFNRFSAAWGRDRFLQMSFNADHQRYLLDKQNANPEDLF
ncbi:hypothetical protein PPL_09087 [Heterostelium album PN500]|uniref:VWFA domain-containing protein n=1 Tax=Heterostelium pallidum (strain ATCC 26659 / Pp 5 / PN500) TaxID=670386 RepID=D3BKK5_HETP5|nr:hypothetical protein PPL_09087 [Heterostelium album PN500]EFA78435.1 hypothetical protein PPL_09087 [Heterostelium album PN500]|eukprot:XP_020430560.1 hypothetical protein PPL_09087 [Heterostelium album PN500]